MTLPEFLLSRIAEDGALWTQARDAGIVMTVNGMSAIPPPSFTQRMATDAEAKRRIVDGHSGWHVCPNLGNDGCTDYGDGSGDEWEAICPTLRILAAVYAHHPDYRDEWKP